MKKEENKVAKNEVEQKEEKVNPIDALFDPDNNGNITLYNEKDEAHEFEQIAVIPLGEKTYAILKPVEKVDGVKDDEAFAFEIVEDEENGDTLKLVEDDKTIDAVFADYDKLLDEEAKKTNSGK